MGWLFGGLYAISPLIWMLPPMIYRVLNPDLTGLADEGAYLLMCKEVLPVGMLGLMLGGMVFATSSSVNTTLNISAGVLANDVYKHFKPETSDKQLVMVGKWSTVGLGILTIIIALLVPYFGGIVEVVMSVAALTGGAMFLPPIWSLFSKNQTGKSAITVTLISLATNSFFKFLAPDLLNIELGRAMEMTLGVGLPVLLMAIYEIILIQKQAKPLQYLEYQKRLAAKSTEELGAAEGNKRGARVIGIGVATTGTIILLLSFLAKNETTLVGSMGLIVGIIGSVIIYKNREKKEA